MLLDNIWTKSSLNFSFTEALLSLAAFDLAERNIC